MAKLARGARQADVPFALVDASSVVRDVVQSMRLESQMPIFDTVEAAAESLLGKGPLERKEFMSSAVPKVLLSAGMIQGGLSGVGRYVVELANRISVMGGVELHVAGLDSIVRSSGSRG